MKLCNKTNCYGRAIFFVSLLLSVLCTIQVLLSFNNWGWHDWDQMFFYHGSPLKSIFEYGQFPLWNPWACGGSVLLQNPQVPFFTPFILLEIIFGVPFGIKLSLFIHFFIGLSGILYIGHHIYKLKSIPLLVLAGSIFIFNGFIFNQLLVGHFWATTIMYLPWIYYFFERYTSTKEAKYLAFTSLLIAEMIFEGGIYPVPLVLLFLGVYSVLKSMYEKKPLYLYSIIKIYFLSFLISSIKLIPVYDFMRHHPRLTSGDEVFNVIKNYFKIFLSRGNFDGKYHLEIFAGQTMPWHEYGCYIGIVLFVMFCVSLLFSYLNKQTRKNESPLRITLYLFILLVLGSFSLYAPYSLLHKLPVFSSLHVTGRFFLVITFLMILITFSCLKPLDEWLLGIKKKKTLNVIIFVIALTTLADLFYVNIFALSDVFSFKTADMSKIYDSRVKKGEYKIVERHYDYDDSTFAFDARKMYPSLITGVATGDCYEPTLADVDTQAGLSYIYIELDKPLIFSDNPKTLIENIKFTPNKTTFSVQADTSSTIYLNQNYVNGWHFSNRDIKVNNVNLKPSVILPAGTYTNVSFYFRPYSIYIGAILSIVGLFISGLLIFRRPKLK